MKCYHGVGIDEIADACGVVRGTVLKYFSSKQGLYRAVLYGRGNPAGDCMKAVCNDTGISVPEVLKQLTEITMKQFKENLKYMGKDMEDDVLCNSCKYILYLVGGGERRYQMPKVSTMVRYINETGRDLWIPFYPLYPDYNFLDETEMICHTHIRMLKDYEANDIAWLGFSAGAE